MILCKRSLNILFRNQCKRRLNIVHFPGIKVFQIAGLILIYFLMRKGIRILRAGGVENDTQYERDVNEQQGVTDRVTSRQHEHGGFGTILFQIQFPVILDHLRVRMLQVAVLPEVVHVDL